MRVLPTNLIAKKNLRSTTSCWLPLLVITLPDDTTFRLARNNEDIAKREDDYSLNGCVGHWRLNDNATDMVVEDASGNGHTGTLIGGKITADLSTVGKINEAFQFDGTADAVQIPDDDAFNFTSYTLAAWVKIPVSSGVGRVIGQQPVSGDYWDLYVGDDGIVHNFDYLDGDALDSVGAVNDDQWHFIVAVRDILGNRTIYIDGELDSSKSSVSSAQHIITADVFLGAHNGTSIFFQGCIDNVMLFNRALSATEVNYLYNQGTGTETIPVLYTAMNFNLDINEQSSRGDIPILTCSVTNITRLLEPKLEEFDGGIGSAVKIIIVNTDLLYEDYAELEMDYDVLSCKTTNSEVVFSLGAASLLRQQFPARKFYALHCAFVAKFQGVECGYSGSELTCEGTLEACRAYGNSARFGGFPGMRSGTVRVVG